MVLNADLTHREIRDAVRGAYSAASLNPLGKHAFPVGRDFAESLGYPRDLLAQLPAAAFEAFTGVSDVSIFAEISSGARVLDLGCGAGLDSLISARRSGPRGTVVGVDFSAAMLERARKSAAEAGLGNVTFCRADAEQLPIRSDSIDVALVNGIFNLNPGRATIFHELVRVLHKGGVAYAAELILRESSAQEVSNSETNWFA